MKKFIRIKALFMAMAISMMMSFTALAATGADIAVAISGAIAAGVSESTIIETVKAAGGGTNSEEVGTELEVFMIDNTRYYIEKVKSDDLKYAITKLSTDKKADDESKKTGASDAKTIIQDSAITDLFKPADLDGAAYILSGFEPLFTLLAGVLATFAIMATSIFTSFDICYLAFPMVHTKIEEAAASGGSLSATNKNGETKFKLMTDDAIYAYKESAKSGQQPWGIYLRRRGVTFIMIAIITYILLTGQVSLFINIALNIVSGILDQLNMLAAGM